MAQSTQKDVRMETYDAGKIPEELLDAWMRMAVGIKGNRILNTLSFNEMVICRLLYRAEQERKQITATDICRHSRLLKSQVNKVLNDLEKAGMIERHRDPDDKRRILIRLRKENQHKYLEEHAHVLQIVREISDRLGREDTEYLIREMCRVVSLMDEIGGRYE